MPPTPTSGMGGKMPPSTLILPPPQAPIGSAWSYLKGGGQENRPPPPSPLPPGLVGGQGNPWGQLQLVSFTFEKSVSLPPPIDGQGRGFWEGLETPTPPLPRLSLEEGTQLYL